MKTPIIQIALLLSSTAYASEYQNALTSMTTAPAQIKNIINQAPRTYSFNNKAIGKSSVSYTGQSFRQVLISDIKKAMSSQLRGSYQGTIDEAAEMLSSYFNYKENTSLNADGVIDGLAEFQVRAYSLNRTPMEISEGFLYSDIQSPGKNLIKKIAGNDNPLHHGKLLGTNRAQTPADLINNYFQEYAANIVDGKNFDVPNGNLKVQTIVGAQTTEYGVDLAQLTQKFLHGAVSYSQAARDYLSTDLGSSKGLNADNTKPAKQGAAYTAMEHHFDEAFGYFGAARDFALYTDMEVLTGSRDTDGDGFISILSEFNTGLSKNTSRFDVTAKDGNVDLSGEVINAFLAGRILIQEKPADYKKYVIAQAKIALGAWEKTLAAVTIHYMNKSISEMEEYGTQKYLFKDFAKYWSEMKGFGLSFQFNPHGILSIADFNQVHALMKDQPVLPHDNAVNKNNYKNDLLKAREILRVAFGFSKSNAQSW